MALMANTGGETMSTISLQDLTTNIIEVRDANGFMGANVPVGSYAMLFDYSGSSFSLYGRVMIMVKWDGNFQMT